MTDVTLYHNPRCSKSRQALELLRERDIDPEIVEYLQAPLSGGELADLLRKLDMSAKDLLRRGEDEFEQLDLASKLGDEAALIGAMARHPILMERPILVRGDQARLGRPPERVLEIL